MPRMSVGPSSNEIQTPNLHTENDLPEPSLPDNRKGNSKGILRVYQYLDTKSMSNFAGINTLSKVPSESKSNDIMLFIKEIEEGKLNMIKFT